MSTKISVAPAHARSWSRCPAWLSMPYDESRNETNLCEGLALHDVAEAALKDRTLQMADFEGTIQMVYGEQVVITSEMLSRVKIYIDYMLALGGELHVESKINCSKIHDRCKGVIDSWLYFPTENWLIVADYKDGRVEVDPFENLQLICYVIGLIDRHFKDRENTLKVSIKIIQPRSRERNKVKDWTVLAPYLRAHVNMLSEAAHNRLSGSPRSMAGEQCMYCARKTGCNSFNYTVENLIHACEHVTNMYDQGERLRLLQFASKMISMSLNAEEAQGLVDIKAGKSIKGFSAGSGRGSWKIKDAEGIKSAAQLFGVDPCKPADLLTPTQLRNAGMPGELLDQYTERVPGKLKLIPVNQSDVRKIYEE